MVSRFLKPPDISNQTLFPWDLLHSGSIISPPISRTLDFSKLPITQTNFFSRGTNLLSITRTCENFETTTPLNKLTLLDKLFSHILITQQASHKSVISLKGTMTASDYRTKVALLNCFFEAVAVIHFVVPSHSVNCAMQSACLTHSAFLLMMRTSIICAKVPGTFLKS